MHSKLYSLPVHLKQSCWVKSPFFVNTWKSKKNPQAPSESMSVFHTGLGSAHRKRESSGRKAERKENRPQHPTPRLWLHSPRNLRAGKILLTLLIKESGALSHTSSHSFLLFSTATSLFSQSSLLYVSLHSNWPIFQILRKSFAWEFLGI